MSLNKLSTELDTRIIEYLDHSGLNAISKASRHYRNISEPRLYRHLQLHANDQLKVKTILVNILRKPARANYISSIDIFPDPVAEVARIRKDSGELESGAVDTAALSFKEYQRQQQAKEREESRLLELRDECWDYLPAIQKAIETYWPNLCRNTKLRWFNLALGPDQPAATMDACIALIMTFARNLERIDYRPQTNTRSLFVHSIICYYRHFDTKTEVAMQPLSKLKEVGLLGQKMPLEAGWSLSWIPFPTEAEILYIQDFGIDHFEFPAARPVVYPPNLTMMNQPRYFLLPMPEGYVPKLRSLHLHHVNVYPHELLATITSGYFRNLRSLRLCSIAPHQSWYAEISYRVFTDALTEHTPNLRELELSIFWDQPEAFVLREPLDAQVFIGSLEGLKDLTHITMDMGLVMDTETTTTFTALLSLTKTILPKHVELVKFTNVKLGCLERLVSNYKKDEVSARAGQLAITSPSWKELILEAYELPRPSVRRVLCEIVSHGVNDGIDFSVYWHDRTGDKSWLIS